MKEKKVFTSEELDRFINSMVKQVQMYCPHGSMELKDVCAELDENNLTLKYNTTLVLPVNELAIFMG